MTTYGDIYLRDNLTDGGGAPSAGVVDASPDLIPYQGSQLTWAQIKTTTSDQGKSILKKGLNHVYVRARNLQPTRHGSGDRPALLREVGFHPALPGAVDRDLDG